ncbi:MAG: PrsW family intramembrane metalloprotease [Planctomycetes bacterium]|nr:PrsW family intramembrane metalloprotease [Planctomycetota bacterium]
MSPWLAIVCGIGPCLVWMFLIHRHDDHEPEPWHLVLLAMVLGALSTIGVLWAQPLMEGVFESRTPFSEAFFVTAVGEEGWKLLALLPLLFHAQLDEPLDGAIYGAAVGLGFAGIENVLYATAGGGDCDVQLLFQRAFTATLVHAACTGCLGFCWAMGKFHRLGRGRVLWSFAGLLVAIPLHGLYDLYLDGDRSNMHVSLLLVLPAAITLLALKVRWARARSPHYHPRR